jgi:1-acyl-sn-glycerol-3-phosphate acyltransferase
MQILARIFNLIVVVLMNLWVYPLLIMWTLIGSLIALPALLVWQLITGWPRAKIMHFFVWIYGRGCILIFRPFIRFECKDLRLENLPHPGIIIMNHNSFFDTYMLCMLPCFDAHICLRSWPFKMFWYSLFMRLAEYFDLESSSWEEIQVGAEHVFRNGRYLIIFPEGHRSRTGKPGRYRSGAFKLAVRFKVPILPLCTTGTQILLPPQRWWTKPARIKMQLLEPVLSDAYHGETAHIEMRKHVQKQMFDTIERLESN